MNIITILLWITIVIIAAIAIIVVKLHYRGKELEHEEGSILPDTKSINEMLSIGSDKLNNKNPSNNTHRSLSPQNNQHNLFRNNRTKKRDDTYIVHEVEDNNLKTFEYDNQNQVLLNYDNTIEKTQEPIKQNQMDIMTQNINKNEDTSELKDLFTIDELIKESKRKDSEREKESQKIKRDEDDEELNNLKESIKNRTEEPLIEEVVSESKEETIGDLIKENDTKDKSADIPSVASQKDIDDAITTASQESEESTESISEEENITDVLLNQTKTEEISEPSLKTPSKVGENKDYKLGASIDDADLFGKEDNEDDMMDLDYRKDLDRFTNKIKGSKIFKEVKEKLTVDNDVGDADIPGYSQETYIRNVNEYEEYEPIFNETHVDFDATYDEYHDERLRQENTRRVFNKAKKTPEPELAQPKVGEIKSKPARSNIKINLNNNEVVLKKGDEIIFNHRGETYSSQVYAINGDDISVKYRRKKIKIKPSDVKKIY